MAPKNNYQGRKYTIVSYNPDWKRRFLSEAGKIKKIFGKDVVDIQHIGSTAIPGVAGKPTLDVLVLVDDVTIAEKHQSQMELLGYDYAGAYVSNDSRLFHKMQNGASLANVHVFDKNHPHVKEMLNVRDYLIRNQDEAVKYGTFKESLFGKHPNDYGAYRKEKDQYMLELMKRATG